MKTDSGALASLDEAETPQEAFQSAIPRLGAFSRHAEVCADGEAGMGFPRSCLMLFLDHPRMRAVKETIEQIAGANITVLIRGESGVGKDIVARLIHAVSPRRAHPFIRVNCAALPAELLESELFGHEKGAFTGAYRRKLGKFEYANGGTILLDEIGEVPLPLQAKLLQVVQDLEFYRIGGRDVIRVDARIIASTNRNLEVAMDRGEFREDLYYRLNVAEIQVPPLRERREDIPAFSSFFLDKYNRQYHRSAALPGEMLGLFQRYAWPGNVRELENAVRRLVVLGNSARVGQDLLARLGSAGRARSAGPEPGEGSVSAADFHEGLGLAEVGRMAARQAECLVLRQTLNQVHWNRAEAARILKVSYKTLLHKIAEYGLASGNHRRKS